MTLRTAAAAHLRIAAPLTLRSVAGELGVPARSMADVLDRLDQHVASRSSGSLSPTGIKGSGLLRITSDGFWTFSGHVHDNSFLKYNYAFAVGLKLDGEAYVFTREHSVANSRDDDFELTGHDQRISANWDRLRDAKAQFVLESSPDIGDLIGHVLVGIVTGLFWAGAIIVTSIFLSDPKAGTIRPGDEPGSWIWEKPLPHHE